ncbi:hypothetical protein [Angustibacter luteus]|uniref:Flp pilus-assembly TadG-like N-terminal domain-containing protein n=1 Tax=Angustibacter luteus TaxID=658456 RepID=A0ABW1JEJ5_9ACTN
MARTFWSGTPRDEGGIVLGWLTKVAVVLAIVGVIAFDVISVVTARLSVEDAGQQAALTASDVWSRTHDVQATLKAAEDSATESNPLNVVDTATFRVDADGTVHLRVTRDAPTLVAHYVKPLREMSEVHADSYGRSGA